MEASWATIVRSYSPQSIEFVGTLIIQILSFWIPSLIYLSLDLFFPSFSQRHKIQPAPKQPTRQDIQKCFAVVAQNQLLTSTLHLVQLSLLKRSSYKINSSFPTITEVIQDFAISLLLREALFYYGHRFLHRPYFYVRIHKQHHKFTAPIALAAQYAHPIEQIFANALPISLPPQMLGSHILTFWIFLAYELFNTATVHSGYDFFSNKAKMHDLHHEKFNLNYGSIGLLDWVHGTDTLEKRRVE
ncbi:putative C-4 methylsterol oxidase [Aspergillus leporis]|jgi:sterol desaturase/sphingolipid hydroxylase (fatty acid hydroxylase superfamily)|uniref:Putative C-4 methylsterol oxidase n=1 Tax=Aspergillus leporis TaxID=41062 RepID=A0A5N5WTB8_9EURO|nr:putative C-4 methylsterol oxidase [Aspergillus leporis]